MLSKENPVFLAEGELKTKKGHKGIFLFLLLLFLGIVGYAAYRYHVHIWLLFAPKEESELVMRFERAQQTIREAPFETSATELRESKFVSEFFRYLKAYLDTRPAEAMGHALSGLIEYELFLLPLRKEKYLYDDLLFLCYIGKYRFPASLDFSLWQKSILTLRKALALGLKGNWQERVNYALASLYLWGGLSYWNAAYSLLGQKDEDLFLKDILNILSQHAPPRFTYLESYFGKESAQLGQAIYYLKSGNTPVGYSLLYQLTNLKERADIRNRALYLLGHVHAKQKHYRQQLYYLRQMDAMEFGKSFPWFIEEYVFLLRFLGDHGTAQRILEEYARLNANK
ncbi:MAG: hypothetical protein NZM25_09240 [Leptospiraceae bacterium]|nr:hypothetical protein [Leptospiraceae bacterium]MDW8307323.1 hypothetical protein [Leptospiraceae bacterium]